MLLCLYLLHLLDLLYLRKLRLSWGEGCLRRGMRSRLLRHDGGFILLSMLRMLIMLGVLGMLSVLSMLSVLGM